MPRAASLATSSRTALTTTVSARSEVGRGEDDGKGGDGTVTAVRGRFDGDSEEKREDDGVERAVRWRCEEEMKDNSGEGGGRRRRLGETTAGGEDDDDGGRGK